MLDNDSNEFQRGITLWNVFVAGVGDENRPVNIYGQMARTGQPFVRAVSFRNSAFTDTSHVAGGPVDLPSPHPLGINYRPVLGLPTPNSRAGRQQVDSHTDVLNDRRSLVQLFIALLDSEKFNARYREIFSSLESRESR